jgi:hypothetical protein
MRQRLPRGDGRAFPAVAPEVNFLLSLIAAGACRSDACMSVFHALLLTAIFDTVGLKIGAVRVAQISRAVLESSAAYLEIDEKEDWICAMIFFKSVTSALAGS